MDGKIKNLAEMLSWIKAKRKMGLKTRRHANWASKWAVLKLPRGEAFWACEDVMHFGFEDASKTKITRLKREWLMWLILLVYFLF